MRQKETKHREVIQAVISEQQEKGYDMLQIKNQFRSSEQNKYETSWSTQSGYRSQHQLRPSPITGVRILNPDDQNARQLGDVIKLYRAKPLRELFRAPLADQSNIPVPRGLKVVEYLTAAEQANEQEVQKMMHRTAAQLKAQILQDAYSNWRYNQQFLSQEIPGQGIGNTWNGPGSYKFDEKGGVWRSRVKQMNERALQNFLDEKSLKASAGANSAHYGTRYTRPSRAFSYQQQEKRLKDIQQGFAPSKSTFTPQTKKRFLSIERLLNRKLNEVEVAAGKAAEAANIIKKRQERGVKELLNDQEPQKHYQSPIWGMRPQIMEEIPIEFYDLDADGSLAPSEAASRAHSSPASQKRYQMDDWGGGYGYEDRGMIECQLIQYTRKPNTTSTNYRSISNYNSMPRTDEAAPVLPHDYLVRRATTLQSRHQNKDQKSANPDIEDYFVNQREMSGHYVQSSWNTFVARLKSIRHLRADRDAQLERNNINALFK